MIFTSLYPIVQEILHTAILDQFYPPSLRSSKDRLLFTAVFKKLVQSWKLVAHYTMRGRVYQFAICIHY
jgi:hypothetical protein